MQLKLKRIAPLQAGKMLAAFYGLLSLLFVPFMLVFMAMGSFAARQQGGSAGPALPLMFGMGLGFMVLLPFFYAAMGFVFGVISAWVYNLLTKWIGGFEFEFETTEPPVSAAT
jgi:hypothetical protein